MGARESGAAEKGEPQGKAREIFEKANHNHSCHPARIRRLGEKMRGLLLKFLALSTEGDATPRRGMTSLMMKDFL